MPRPEYLEWTSTWVQRRRGSLSPDGSLFLNVGSKPTDPWLAMDVAQAARRHLQLQNTIHWIKSIAIEKALAGRGPASTRIWRSDTTSRSTANDLSTTVMNLSFT